jgi:2,5-diamino-6-(ribosylamino)-4(3H)-pyrimidinone 5'-phosphate reductase
LAGVLIDAGLVDEIRLLIAPEIVGKKAVNLFRSLNRKKRLELIRVENIKGHALLVYRIAK